MNMTAERDRRSGYEAAERNSGRFIEGDGFLQDGSAWGKGTLKKGA